MFVQQQQLRGDDGGHEQSQCLTLTAGEQPHRLAHPVFQIHTQQGQVFSEQFFVLFGHSAEKGVVGGTGTEVSNGQVLLDGHMGSRALHGILEQVSNVLAPPMLFFKGDVHAVQFDGAILHEEGASDGVEHGGFACAIAAHDGGKIPSVQLEIQAVQGFLLVDGAGVKGLVEVGQFQHTHFSSFSVPAAAFSVLPPY